MKTTVCALALLLLVPGVARAQTPDQGSTGTHLVRAAGMPLGDGTLPPGVLTVRVVRGSFDDDLVGQAVEMAVTGGRIDSALTGDDGRAQFAHLPVGGEIRVSATIAGVRLESESFTMPADSGVRVLLVAGEGSAIAATSAHPPVGLSTTAAVSVPLSRGSGEDPVVTTIRAVLATSTIFALGFVALRRRRQEPGPPARQHHSA